MLLSKTKICAELGKIYPDFIFNTKFANSFISVIKSSVLRNFYDSLIGFFNLITKQFFKRIFYIKKEKHVIKSSNK